MATQETKSRPAISPPKTDANTPKVEQGEATTFARPGHAQLGGGTAHAARHTGKLAVHVGLELEEVQVAPTALSLVMQFLVGRRTCRTGRALGLPHHI